MPTDADVLHNPFRAVSTHAVALSRPLRRYSLSFIRTHSRIAVVNVKNSEKGADVRSSIDEEVRALWILSNLYTLEPQRQVPESFARNSAGGKRIPMCKNFVHLNLAVPLHAVQHFLPAPLISTTRVSQAGS